MKVVSTEALTKLIQLVKSAFISVDDTVETSEVELLDIVASKDLSNITQATKSDVTSWGMPSDSYIDLTLGASGTEYTAPANGYYVINKSAATGKYIVLQNISSNFRVSMVSSNDNQCNLILPVKIGDVMKINYTAAGATDYFRFIYAEGEI